MCRKKITHQWQNAYCQKVTDNIRRAHGQLTLFFGVAIIGLVTVIAIIVNVGLYVKAKINLQNAVDAAAWSGAAVQSRQLTNIAYMNWEMRNVYKEWMFKYYVLGHLSLPRTRKIADNLDDADETPSTHLKLTLKKFDSTTDSVSDLFNVPSICINFADTANICSITSVPGLPRWTQVGLPGLDETYTNFLNTIVENKAQDCSVRGNLNYLTALAWAYGTPKLLQSLVDKNIPIVGNETNVGAWPKAYELALRIRNLERIVNQPPAAGPICIGGENCTDYSAPQFQQQSGDETSPPLYERSQKALWAAFRNLGTAGSEIKRTFQLTELAPVPYAASPVSPSGALIPQQFLDKHYLDLQLLTVNLATFYTLFTSTTSAGNQVTGAVVGQAKCASIKAALPVPGYPIGFVKNPRVMTYYAVKGTAEFNGLFNPFNSEKGTRLIAAATAKPFGGRIGPRLFSIPDNGTAIKARSSITYPYLMGFSPQDYDVNKGTPIPVSEGGSSNFWFTDQERAIGGIPDPSQPIQFAIPNLIYIYDQPDTHTSSADELVDVFTTFPAGDGPNNNINRAGLYNKNQYKAFASNLDVATNSLNIGPEDVDRAVRNVRRPTNYEALNYLFPTKRSYPYPGLDSTELDSIAAVEEVNTGEPDNFTYRIYAPFFGEGLLYNNFEEIRTSMAQIIDSNESAVLQYLSSLKIVSDKILAESSDPDNALGLYNKAAAVIHDVGPLTCASMAGTFSSYFLDNVAGCDNGNGNVLDNLIEEWDDMLNNPDRDGELQKSNFLGRYSNPNAEEDKTHFFPYTAYFPPQVFGMDNNGNVKHPFLETNEVSFRNYYSTKFVPTNYFQIGDYSSFTTFSEGKNTIPTENSSGPIDINLINRLDFSTDPDLGDVGQPDLLIAH